MGEVLAVVPDKRIHRGPHPEDQRLFAPDQHERLRQAVAHFSWLLTHNYAEPSALKIVGDHFLLDARQRTAVMRCACSDQALASRKMREVSPEVIRHQHLLLDGYNILTTAEAAHAGGVLILGRDGCIRDMASMHGSFRKVEETPPAIELIGTALFALHTASVTWYLDSPVSNSGRLKTIIRQIASTRGWNWQIEIVPSPDQVLSQADQIIVTADSVVLDRCRRWFNLARHVVARIEYTTLVDLRSRTSVER